MVPLRCIENSLDRIAETEYIYYLNFHVIQKIGTTIIIMLCFELACMLSYIRGVLLYIRRTAHSIYSFHPDLSFVELPFHLLDIIIMWIIYCLNTYSLTRREIVRMQYMNLIPNTAVFGPTKLIGTIPSTMRMRMKILDED